jgi:hypothetical protein
MNLMIPLRVMDVCVVCLGCILCFVCFVCFMCGVWFMCFACVFIFFSLSLFIFFSFIVYLSFLFPFHLFFFYLGVLLEQSWVGLWVWIDFSRMGWESSNGRWSVKVSGWDRTLQNYQRYPFHRCISIILHHFNENLTSTSTILL